jgi:hypothetical protein
LLISVRYIVFAVLNAAIIVPITYCFFPETAGMRLEDIDHIFEKGGITGGVLSKGGRFADRRHDIEEVYHHSPPVGSSSQSPAASEIYEHEEKK